MAFRKSCLNLLPAFSPEKVGISLLAMKQQEVMCHVLMLKVIRLPRLTVLKKYSVMGDLKHCLADNYTSPPEFQADSLSRSTIEPK
jgi:hypothetical protein